MTVIFNTNGFAETSGEITVYCTDSQDIYSHSTTEYVSEGGSLATGSYLDAPPQAKQGFAIVRTENGWEYQADHRGTYYSTETGKQIKHSELGEIPPNLTALKPLNVPCKWNGSMWVKDEEKFTALLTERKNAVLLRLAAKADELKNGLLAGYPQTEIESFYRQEKEALAWQADHNTPTSMLSQIARVRGVPLEVLISKVIEKSAQFAVAIGIIIGQRQAFEDRLMAVQTLEELEPLSQEIAQWQFQVN